jgi:hypothetical protein
MATKKQRDFLKSVLPNKFYIRKEFEQEQVYCYYSNLYDYGYKRLGELNYVIENYKEVLSIL